MTTTNIPDLLESAHQQILDARKQAPTHAIRDELDKASNALDRAAVLAEEWEPHPEADQAFDDVYSHCRERLDWDNVNTDGAVVERPAPDHYDDWCRVTIGKVMWLFQMEADGDFNGDRFVDKSRWTIAGRYLL